ncbi:uncharacterized protein [Anas platyrhynchos]|uniref:uncharacterized protein n=1 Tax=Anas platyrhynchos TaxID=8839 RepID=UPI003AF2D8E7
MVPAGPAGWLRGRGGTARHGSARLGGTRHGPAPHGTDRPGSGRIASDRTDTDLSARSGVARSGSARLGSARFGPLAPGAHSSARPGTAGSLLPWPDRVAAGKQRVVPGCAEPGQAVPGCTGLYRAVPGRAEPCRAGPSSIKASAQPPVRSHSRGSPRSRAEPCQPPSRPPRSLTSSVPVPGGGSPGSARLGSARGRLPAPAPLGAAFCPGGRGPAPGPFVLQSAGTKGGMALAPGHGLPRGGRPGTAGIRRGAGAGAGPLGPPWPGSPPLARPGPLGDPLSRSVRWARLLGHRPGAGCSAPVCVPECPRGVWGGPSGLHPPGTCPLSVPKELGSPQTHPIELHPKAAPGTPERAPMELGVLWGPVGSPGVTAPWGPGCPMGSQPPGCPLGSRGPLGSPVVPAPWPHTSFSPPSFLGAPSTGTVAGTPRGHASTRPPRSIAAQSPPRHAPTDPCQGWEGAAWPPRAPGVSGGLRAPLRVPGPRQKNERRDGDGTGPCLCPPPQGAPWQHPARCPPPPLCPPAAAQGHAQGPFVLQMEGTKGQWPWPRAWDSLGGWGGGWQQSPPPPPRPQPQPLCLAPATPTLPRGLGGEGPPRAEPPAQGGDTQSTSNTIDTAAPQNHQGSPGG